MNEKRSHKEDANANVEQKKTKVDTALIKHCINSSFTKADFVAKFQQRYSSGEADKNDAGIELLTEPFKCCVLPNFVESSEFLDNLEKELLDLKFYDKSNDLYKFKQSDDLKNIHTPYVSRLREILYTELRDWMSMVTGIPLTDTVDLSCSQYNYTDTLLCHDDELEGRRIAFILYLVPSDWSEEDGGALDLFDVNKNGHPTNIVRSVLPVRNNLAFFEVTPVSFHQVAEVLSESKCRLSITGWLHGSPITRPEPHIEPQAPLTPCICIEEKIFYEWVNPIYLNEDIQSEIQEKFEADSEIELQNFLKVEKYEALMEACQSADITWDLLGPANKRSYHRGSANTLPTIIQEFIELMKSDAMFLVLADLTGLTLHELTQQQRELNSSSTSATSEDSTKNPRCSVDVCRWGHGSYTLLHDTDIDQGSDYALDGLFFIGCQDWKQEYGGYVSYIVKDEDEELLSVLPVPNSLALVYRDQETLRFVKHVNNKVNTASHRQFYTVSAVYYE